MLGRPSHSIILAICVAICSAAIAQNNTSHVNADIPSILQSSSEWQQIRRDKEELKDQVDRLRTRLGFMEERISNSRKEEIPTILAIMKAVYGMPSARKQQVNELEEHPAESPLGPIRSESTTPTPSVLTSPGVDALMRLLLQGLPSMFDRARWMHAFEGGPRYAQRPQEINDYPVFIIPESSFHQIGQPLPRHYPVYPPTLDQGYVQHPLPKPI